MISLRDLAELYQAHRAEVDTPVGPLLVGDRSYDVDTRPAVMGTINLSRASTYRESVAVSTDSAVRKGRVLAAQGADFLDIGAESSTANAPRVSAEDQTAALLPVVRQLVADGISVSVETYHVDVARACLNAGALIINYTGSTGDEAMFDAVAERNATLVLCRVEGANVREIRDVRLDGDPIPEIIEHFTSRIDAARARGVQRIVLDPGMGFFYGNLVDPQTRVRHQTAVLLGSVRLRGLGLPVCHALPHAFDLFEDEFRSAEAFFAVLAQLGGAAVLRTHEVSRVVAVLNALQALGT